MNQSAIDRKRLEDSFKKNSKQNNTLYEELSAGSEERKLTFLHKLNERIKNEKNQ